MYVKITPLNTENKIPVYTTPLKWAWALRAYGLKNLRIERTNTAILVLYRDIPVQKVEAVETINRLQPA